MSAVPSVCVVGSFMCDIVLPVPRRPERGETLLIASCSLFLGGKGFNQAVAARRMGARVAIIGCLGDDPFAGQFRAALAREGIDGSGVAVNAEAGTGIAVPMVEPDGANSIVAAGRANLRLAAADVERAAALIRTADVVLLQMEVPAEASTVAARIARTAGVTVVLNPAPAVPVPEELLALADVLTPNEVEAAALTGMRVDGVERGFAAAEALCARGVPRAIVTLGQLGCVAVGPGLHRHHPAHAVEAVDSTAAGDAFSGALAAALAEGVDIEEALRWANAAGACAVTRLGAEPSLPRRADVLARLTGVWS